MKTVNDWLEKMDINASIIEDSAHAINDKCEMNLRLEPRVIPLLNIC